MYLNTTGKNQHYMDKFTTFNSDIITITPEYVVNFLQNAINKAKVSDIDFDSLYDAVIRGLPKSITPNDFYNYIADKCVVRTSQETNYNKLAATILVERLHKITNDDYVTAIELLYNNKDVKDRHCPLVSQELYNLVLKNKEQIQKAFDYERDYNLDYFAIRTLERSYLIKLKGKTGDVLIERPQHMFMRVALGIHNKNLKAAFETYDLMSNRYFTHATPTLFNAGTRRPQLSSCFVENTEVLTLNEGIKNIQDVKIDDIVITHTGKSQKVKQIHKNLLGDRKVLKLSVAKTKDIYVTDNHKFWSLTDKKNPEWNSVSNLLAGDYIAIPNYYAPDNKYTIDTIEYLKAYTRGTNTSISFKNDDNNVWSETNTTHSNLNNVDHEVTIKSKSMIVKRKWEVTQDFANLIGIYLGDGNLITKIRHKHKEDERTINGIAFTIYNKNKPEIDFIKRVGKEIFGIDSKEHIVKNQNVIQIMYHSTVVGMVFYKLFGKGFNGKYIPNFLFQLPTKTIYSLLAGLITTDGCIAKNTLITLQMSNKQLMNQLYHLFRSRNIDVSIKAVAKMPKNGTILPYMMCIPKIEEILKQTYKYYEDNRLQKCYDNLEKDQIKNRTSPIIINGTKFLRIDSVEETKLKPTYVYTLGIENDHSYSVEGLICENCFLISCDDSLEEIFNCISQIASISKWAGGIGVHVAGVRPKNAVIRGTNGRSEGIIPLCSLLNKESKYVNQGGKRNGSIAVYNEPWHGDIFEFCELRKNTGSEDLRARDLFFSLWIPDLFMKRVEEDGIWSLMCPDECRGLNTSHGEEFEKLYTQYEQEGKFLKQVPARKLWKHILECQIETGFPYMCYKDNANKRSNQQNLGTIRSSNLCVSGSTKILTDNGEIEIGKNVNTQVNVWNGEEWSPVILKQTGSNVSLTKVSFSNGATLLCTSEHKFLVNGNLNKIETKNLKIGDNINEFKLPDNTIVKNISITKLEFDFSIEDTFCFTEHKCGLGVFNGLLIGQCAEIIEYSDSTETAVCNLSSICLPRFITVSEDGTKTFNHEELIKVCRVAVRNLNKVIDRNFYPTKETQHSNFKHRPVAIGVQGLSDVYNIMQMSWDSDESRLLNKQIFETIYYGCLDESKELAKKFGQYVSFTGSPFSKGQLQYDLWGLTEKDLTMGYDWLKLKEEIKQYGTRNSLLTALMPTASTAQIMGCSECMEPYMSNIFVRTTLAGEFIVINENLQRDLKKLGLWSQDMYKKLVIYRGSIQSIPEIPDKIKDIYKTGFELPLRAILQQSVERGPFIDQSQSLNLFMAEPDFTFLTSAHFYGWKNGLKTGMYYLRGTPAVDPVSFGIDVNDIKRLTNNLDPVKAIKDNYATTKLRNRLLERKENSETNSNDPIDNDNDSEEEPVMCRYDPSKKAEGCLMCQ